MSVESFSRPSQEKENKSDVQKEIEAEKELQSLLDDPDNAFLTTVTANHEVIENSPSAVEALAYAKKKIVDRLSRTTEFQSISAIEGVKLLDVDFVAMKRTVDTILNNQVEIGRGGDAFVVIDKNEIRTLPPEICYKFSLTESTPRGRNSTKQEAEIQGRFYEVAKELEDSKIGIPVPFYSLEISSKKMIAMEKLPAKSIDDILRGRGYLPAWFDVDTFVSEIEKMLAHFHKAGLYHRDMHFGNIMITQAEELGPDGKWGYIIDFGLSGHQEEERYAYEKQVAGSTFTYEPDYGILPEVKRELKRLQSRQGVWK